MVGPAEGEQRDEVEAGAEAGAVVSSSSLGALTVPQLQRECVRRGLGGYSRLRKAELIALLLQPTS